MNNKMHSQTVYLLTFTFTADYYILTNQRLRHSIDVADYGYGS